MLQTEVTIAVDVDSDVLMCCSGRQIISPFPDKPFNSPTRLHFNI